MELIDLGEEGNIYIWIIGEEMTVSMLVNSCFFQFHRFHLSDIACKFCFVTIENGTPLHHFSCSLACVCVRVSLRFWRGFKHYCVLQYLIWNEENENKIG